MLSAIHTVKFCAWEEQVLHRMRLSRESELQTLYHRQLVKAGALILLQILPSLVTVVTFYFYTAVCGNVLDASTAFASLAFFSMLDKPLSLLLEITTLVSNAWVSCQRLDIFLQSPETNKDAQLSVPTRPDEPTIGFKNATISLEDDVATGAAHLEGANPGFRLVGINIDFPLGELSIITGPVGSGKTTLLLGLLGETYLHFGQIFMPAHQGATSDCKIDPITGLSDTIAYCGQVPWLLSATIRENITFGNAWNRKRYDEVVEACALMKDFDILEHRDRTQVGERGIKCELLADRHKILHSLNCPSIGSGGQQ